MINKREIPNDVGHSNDGFIQEEISNTDERANNAFYKVWSNKLQDRNSEDVPSATIPTSSRFAEFLHKVRTKSNFGSNEQKQQSGSGLLNIFKNTKIVHTANNIESEKAQVTDVQNNLQTRGKVHLQTYTNKGFSITSSDEIQIQTSLQQDPIHEISLKESQYEEGKEKIGKSDDDRTLVWTQIFGAVTSAFVHFAVGCVIGFTGVTLPSLMDPEEDVITLDMFQASIFSSIVNIGAIGGSVLSSLMMTWLGQRSTLLVYLPIGMSFWIIMSFAKVFWLLVLSRVIQGIVIGICAGCANNYVVETVHRNYRGSLCGLIDLSRQIGLLYMYIIGSSNLSWRHVGLICGLTSMALPFIGMLFLPHSPRWLSLKGRKEEARKALQFFRSANYDIDSEIREIQEQTDKNSKGSNVCVQLKKMTERSIAYRFSILAILLFASHFTGNFALISYSVSIFKSAEVQISPYLSTMIVACARVIGVVIYITIADKFGRRPLFIIPVCLSGLAMIILGSFFYVKTLYEDVSAISWLPLASAVFYVIFGMMSHPVLMLLRSELLPTSVRSVGVGLLYLAFFCGSFAVSISYPYMVHSVGSQWTFWLYGATSFMMAAITAFSIPETQGKSLEEIGELFEKKKTPV